MSDELSPISCTIIDETIHGPAVHVPVVLSEHGSDRAIATGDTDRNGECRRLLPPTYRSAERATYQLIAQSSVYFTTRGLHSTIHSIPVIFALSLSSPIHIAISMSTKSYSVSVQVQ